MFDAVKNYLALASGVTEVTRHRALAAARALVSSGEATAEQVTTLADDLLTTSRNNRDTVLALVRYEIDRALSRLGLATSEEMSALAARVTVLESSVRVAQQKAAGTTPVEAPAGVPVRPTKRATKAVRKAPAKRSPAKRAPAKRVAGSPAVRSQPASTAEAPPAQQRAAKTAAKRARKSQAGRPPAAPPAGGAAGTAEERP